ncbi:MAG: hypothetical protein GOMPHAMPRED_006483 [Gomphillus americanus]|uniref:Uncharacterized protein n=1 Tax=Gomphillus americanus TaxID=1940652 RepID=A0A8H3FZK7_9LECA|nr:MAG: hypothetical protein GOMPHAMPRED_006483 [Gomphillus americanus]
MKHTILFLVLSVTSITTAAPNNRYGANTETWRQGKYIPIQARDLDQNSFSIILPRNPSGPSSSGQARSDRENPRSQNRDTTPRPPPTEVLSEGVGRSQRPARERGRNSIRSSTPAQINDPIRGNTSNQRVSPAISNASSRSSSPTQSQPSDETYRSARSRSRSPVSLGSIRRATSIPHHSQSPARSVSSSTSGSSGSDDYPMGTHGEIPFPYDTIPPTSAAAGVRGPAVLSKSAPHMETSGGTIPYGYTGSTHVVNPYKSKVTGIAYVGVSKASAVGDTASARVTTGPRSWGRLTASTTTGAEVIHVNPNSTRKIRAQTEEPGNTQARATAQLWGAGSFSARGRNLRRRALSRSGDLTGFVVYPL